MTFRDALLLGRVSNLPTVWTNMLAGVALAGGSVLGGGFAGTPVPTAATLLLTAALTLFYVGGMYLNDAFDAAIDARERPERPIPGGRVSRSAVFQLGFGMLALGLAGLFFAGRAAGTGLGPIVFGAVLCVAIVAYDAWHKSNPLSPVVMGVCRMAAYLTAGAVVVGLPPAAVWVGGAIALGYLIGLTYIAKQENLGSVSNLWPLVFLAAPLLYAVPKALSTPALWAFAAVLAAWIVVALSYIRRRGPGDIPRAVISLIAGISLVDALLIATTGAWTLALIAACGFALTLVLQRVVPGT